MSSIKQNRDLEFSPESIHGIYGVNYYFQALPGVTSSCGMAISLLVELGVILIYY